MRDAGFELDEQEAAALSAQARDIMDLFAQLGDQGHTIVVITHDAALANRTGRQIELHDGRITSDRENGKPAAVPLSHSLE